MPAKVDFKTKYKTLYKPTDKKVSIVDVPEFQFMMIDGNGYPGEENKEYTDVFACLYPVGYKLKFESKEEGQDYVVMPSEGLWWAEDMDDFSNGIKDNWKWTMMMMVPSWITQKQFKEAVNYTLEKKPDTPKVINKMRLEKFKEGKSAQILYFGPYSDEGPTIEKIHETIKELGGKFDGHKQKHHEIYISDVRRTAPEKLKTVIRQPFTL